MRKYIVRLTVIVTFAALSVVAQNSSEIPGRGIAPQTQNGIGRADVRVYDEAGQPLQGIYVHLTSHRSDGFTCEAWNITDADGRANLPPLHMNRLTFDVNRRDDINKAVNKNFQKYRVEYTASDLSHIIRIVLPKK